MSDDAANRPERDAKGRLLPGHRSPGPGRPGLPDWFKAKGEERLRAMDAHAGDKTSEHHFDALKWCLERQYGKAVQAVDITGDELVSRTADALLQLAGVKKPSEDDPPKD